MSEAQLDRLAHLIATSPHNLVSRRERPAVRSRHIDEAVAVGSVLRPEPHTRWVDLGTGGGLPGLVLAICYPRTSWTLIDATGKKIVEVQRFADDLGLGNVTAVHGRAETVASGALRASCDGVVARAVAPMTELVALARGLLVPGGRLAAIKGPAWAADLARARPVLQGLGLGEIHSQAVPGTVRPTWLVTMRATTDWPAL